MIKRPFRNYVFGKWREISRIYGYHEYDGPILEPTDLYKKKSGKLFAGPVWDFNIAMGNVTYNDNWLTEGSLLASKYLSSILLEDSSFVSAYQVRWNTLRNNQLTISMINS